MKTSSYSKANFLLLFIASYLFSTGLGAASEIPYSLSFPPASVPDQVIVPGGSGTLSFTLTNTSSGAGTARLGGYFAGDAEALGGYVFTASDPSQCLSPVLETSPADFERIVFTTGVIAPGSSLTCNFQITRGAASLDDLNFHLCGAGPFGSFCEYVFRRGTLPDQALVVEPAFPGAMTATDAVLRIRMINSGPVAVASRNATTECSEYEGGIFSPGPFSVDSTYPGSCPAGQGEICLNFTGQNFMSYGFELGPAPAGGESSCLVRLEFTTPESRNELVEFYFLDDSLTLANGRMAFDANRGNDATLMGGGFAVSGTIPIPVGDRAMAIMAAAVLLAAALRFRLKMSDAARC